jgi:4-hydroxy-3-methylbut-2-enyl diphosphate reductase
LAELAKRKGASSYLIDSKDDIQPQWLNNIKVIGVTAGASAPEELVQDVVRKLQELGASAPEEITGTPENITFSLPQGLRWVDASSS